MLSASYGYVDNDHSGVKKLGDGDGADGVRASTEYIVVSTRSKSRPLQRPEQLLKEFERGGGGSEADKD